MGDLQLLTTCKGRLDHLRQTLPTWLAHTSVGIIVVDYDCPDRCGERAAAQDPRIQVVRVPDRSAFNLSEARNAGLAVATAPWVGFIDADVFLAPDFEAQVTAQLQEGRYLLVDQPEGDLFGTMVAPRSVLQSLGGYDEAFEGWGVEDMDMRRRLEVRGLVADTMARRLFDFIPHGDDRRAVVHGWKARGLVINRLYADAKVASEGALRRELTLAERKDLYGRVARLFHTLPPRALPELRLATPWAPWCPGLEARITLGFEFRTGDSG